MRTRVFTALLATAALAASTTSCNLFGSFDKPSEPDSILTAAIARANSGDCAGAVRLLKTIQYPSDDALIALGWAQLCMAGATAATVAQSVYKYTSSNNNSLTVLGTLAQNLVPMDADKPVDVEDAINTFNRITNERRPMELGISYLVKAASVLARQADKSASTDTLDKDDITGSSCDAHAANCALAFGSGDCDPGISASDIAALSTALTNAVTNFQNAGVANMKDLANRIKLGLGADNEIARCFLRTSVIPQ